MDNRSSDSTILQQIRELAEGLSDSRSRAVISNVVGALELNPQPLPPGIVRIVLEAIALNPQPLPPVEGSGAISVESSPGDAAPSAPAVLRTVLEAIALNPQPLPPAGTSLR